MALPSAPTSRLAGARRGGAVRAAHGAAHCRRVALAVAAHGPGAGLGLAIVERIARSHGGTLDLLPVAPHGLLARLRPPLAAAR